MYYLHRNPYTYAQSPRYCICMKLSLCMCVHINVLYIPIYIYIYNLLYIHEDLISDTGAGRRQGNTSPDRYNLALIYHRPYTNGQPLNYIYITTIQCLTRILILYLIYLYKNNYLHYLIPTLIDIIICLILCTISH